MPESTELNVSHNSLQSQEEDSYVHAATSDSTREAYQRDVQDFFNAGEVLPATPEAVAAYLRARATTLNPRTLKRRVTALRQWHIFQGHSDPTQHPLIVKTLSGIARLHGKPRKQAQALGLKELDKIVAYCQAQSGMLAIRNRALLLIGFFGAFRRSELVSLTWEQVQFVKDGMIIQLHRSKTDQIGEGARCVIPFGDDKRCPIRALIDWRQVSAQWEGPLFRRVSKAGKLLAQAITPRYWNTVLRDMAQQAGCTHAAQVSSHSLRRGFATEAARLGASMPAIQHHGRWRSTKTVIEYIEAGRSFEDSAVKVLFEF